MTKEQTDRYHARYRDGYYVVFDTTTGEVVPPDSGHYKKYRDGYLWDYAAASEADRLNRAGDARRARPPADGGAATKAKLVERDNGYFEVWQKPDGSRVRVYTEDQQWSLRTPGYRERMHDRTRARLEAETQEEEA